MADAHYTDVCGCTIVESLDHDGRQLKWTEYCPQHAAAPQMHETLKSTGAYFEMLEAATGVEHPQLAEIRATLALADAEYPVQGRNR